MICSSTAVAVVAEPEQDKTSVHMNRVCTVPLDQDHYHFSKQVAPDTTTEKLKDML